MRSILNLNLRLNLVYACLQFLNEFICKALAKYVAIVLSFDDLKIYSSEESCYDDKLFVLFGNYLSIDNINELKVKSFICNIIL